MRAIIMAGGKGVRLRPITKVIPKPLIPLGDIPILEIILRQLRFCGFTHVTLTLGYKADMIRQFFGDGRTFGLTIDYTEEVEPLGTFGPIGLVHDLEEPFLMMNADLLTDLDFKAFYERHVASRAITTVMLSERHTQIDFGVIETNEQGEVVEYKEKPRTSYRVSSGIYMMSPLVKEYAKDKPIGIPELITQLTSEGLAVHSYLHQGTWMDIGTPTNLEEAAQYFEEHIEKFLPIDTLSGRGVSLVNNKKEMNHELESLSL